ncbi:MAG: acetate--CoA ligase family protein [Candidatus Nanohalobium sp.]
MLDQLFYPGSVAVVGASRYEGKTGHEVFVNLLDGFEGDVVPVNPNAEVVEGVEAVDEVPSGMDLVVVAVPAGVVPEVLRDAAGKGVDAAVVVSAGFSESGRGDLEDEVVEVAEENGISLLGPNVLGLINTENSMNASFASEMPELGDISFMSQSGAFCTAVLDYAKAEHIGFRHFVSLGNKSVLDEVDFMRKWRNDETGVILSYTEGIEDGREFMWEAEKTSREKPVVVVKSGRTSEGGEAASSHTGSIAGSYQAYQAAFRKAGVVEAESSRDLLDFGRAFSYQSLPQGGEVAVVTNAGGPGVITTDELSGRGLELAEFSADTEEALRGEMPEESSPANPLDVIGDAGSERYRKALETVVEDENVDAVIVLLTPQANTEVVETAEAVVDISENSGKPVFASFIGEKQVGEGKKTLERGNVPEFEDPVDAVKTLKAMVEYRKFLTQERTYRDVEHDCGKASEAVENYSGYMEAHSLLDSYGFTLPETVEARSVKEAGEAAETVGCPAAMKIDSPDISHKTELDAVKTGLESREEVEKEFNSIIDSVYMERPDADINGVVVQEHIDGLEVAVGMKRDPQFGPMILVGLGGIYIEALQDVSFGIAPISEQEAEHMIEELRSSELFEGVRGEESHMEPVKDAIIRLGELALNHEEVESLDINPLIVDEDAAYAADIQVELVQD